MVIFISLVDVPVRALGARHREETTFQSPPLETLAKLAWCRSQYNELYFLYIVRQQTLHRHIQRAGQLSQEEDRYVPSTGFELRHIPVRDTHCFGQLAPRHAFCFSTLAYALRDMLEIRFLLRAFHYGVTIPPPSMTDCLVESADRLGAECSS